MHDKTLFGWMTPSPFPMAETPSKAETLEDLLNAWGGPLPLLDATLDGHAPAAWAILPLDSILTWAVARELTQIKLLIKNADAKTFGPVEQVQALVQLQKAGLITLTMAKKKALDIYESLGLGAQAAQHPALADLGKVGYHVVNWSQVQPAAQPEDVVKTLEKQLADFLKDQ